MFDFLDTTPVNLFSTPAVDTSNWQRCFFDLEGSLNARDGSILQLACIITDWNFKIIDAHSEYFLNVKPINPEEMAVHGITESFVKKNAKGTFIERFDTLPINVKKPTMFISYTTFDVSRINEELKVHNLPPHPFGEEVTHLAHSLESGNNVHFNAFSLGRKKGEKLVEELGMEPINKIFKELRDFGNFKNAGNHDALFDTAMILALCRRF